MKHLKVFENINELSEIYNELKEKSLTPRIKNFKLGDKSLSVTKVVMYLTNKVMSNVNLSDETKILFIIRMFEMLDYNNSMLHQFSFSVLISLNLDTIDEELLLSQISS